MYVDSICSSELEIKDIKDILLNRDISGKLTSVHYDRRDDFNFPIVNSPCSCSNISSSAQSLYVLHLIRCARTCAVYEQVLSRGKLLTNKLFLQGFQQSRLRAAFRKFDGRYNNCVCPQNMSLIKSNSLKAVFIH